MTNKPHPYLTRLSCKCKKVGCHRFHGVLSLYLVQTCSPCEPEFRRQQRRRPVERPLPDLALPTRACHRNRSPFRILGARKQYKCGERKEADKVTSLWVRFGRDRNIMLKLLGKTIIFLTVSTYPKLTDFHSSFLSLFFCLFENWPCFCYPPLTIFNNFVLRHFLNKRLRRCFWHSNKGKKGGELSYKSS